MRWIAAKDVNHTATDSEGQTHLVRVRNVLICGTGDKIPNCLRANGNITARSPDKQSCCLRVTRRRPRNRLLSDVSCMLHHNGDLRTTDIDKISCSIVSRLSSSSSTIAFEAACTASG